MASGRNKAAVSPVYMPSSGEDSKCCKIRKQSVSEACWEVRMMLGTGRMRGGVSVCLMTLRYHNVRGLKMNKNVFCKVGVVPYICVSTQKPEAGGL